MLQWQLYRPRGWALANNQVKFKVLHCRIQKLLNHVVESMDFVNEEDIPFFKVGQNSGQVTGPLNDRSGCRSNRDVHFTRNDIRQRRLS